MFTEQLSCKVNIHCHWGEQLFKYILKQWDNIIQKNDLDSFIMKTITLFSGTNPMYITHKWKAKDPYPGFE